MAITHADLAPRPKTTTHFGTAFLTVFTILCGLLCFVLCLLSEASRSQVTWLSGETRKYECVYSGSGKMALVSAAAAFLGLAVAMVINHTFILISVSKAPPPDLVAVDSGKTLTFQAAFCFVATWTCFAVSEILLLIGLSVESGHLRNWSSPRPNCLVVGQGLFSAAGVFALLTGFLAAGLYLTALRAFQELEHNIVRQEQAFTPYATPSQLTVVVREDPVTSEYDHLPPPSYGFIKNPS